MGTQQPHAAADVGGELLKFMRDLGLPDPSFFEATPEIIAQFLIVREEGGITVVHGHKCVHLGFDTSFPDCLPECAVRAAAASTRTRLGTLNGIFRDQVSNERWHGSGGNPCKSAIVEKLVARIDLEQLEAGVKTKQAPLLSQEQFWQLLSAVDKARQQAVAKFDPLEALLAARDKFILVVMWNTGLRPSDATRLLTQNVLVKPEGLSLHVGVTKTGKKVHHARTLLLDSVPTPEDAKTTWIDFLAEVAKFGLRLEPGFLFREPKLARASRIRSWGGHTSWSHIDKRLALYLTAAGIPLDTKPHSMHGSKAKYDYESGVPMSDTLEAMDWSSTSYKHYLKGRVEAAGSRPAV
jgi:integrase